MKKISKKLTTSKTTSRTTSRTISKKTKNNFYIILKILVNH